MSEQDLENLMNEMEFSTPLRDKVKEDRKDRRVFISEPSVSKATPNPNFGEMSLPTARIMTNIRAGTDELVPYTTGTSYPTDDLKKYKLFIVDEPKEICGTVMG